MNETASTLSVQLALPPPVSLPLFESQDFPCPYLPDRIARHRATSAELMTAETYHDFMDAGFRRSGGIVYQPVCSTCRECVPIRVPVDRFAPSKSQRRCLRKNAELQVAIESRPQPSMEKFELYQRYVSERHGETDASPQSFVTFLYNSPINTIEFTYRSPSGQLIAVGICDVCSRSLSSVYFYFEPTASRRGLGTFGALREIQFAKDRGIPHYYLGFWVRECRTMRYKRDFEPCEYLCSEGTWKGREAGEKEFAKPIPTSGREEDVR